jgi:uncharacterized protein
MAEWRVVRNATTESVVLPRARVCASTWCHFKGLQFSRTLPPGEGLLFIYPRESRSSTAIHMFFVFFDISVIWMDANRQVVDTTLARPWRPFYAPAAPAQYFIEARPEILDQVSVGDILRFDEVAR